MTPEGVCAYYADHYCEADKRCAYDFEVGWNDLATCKERVKINCLLRVKSPGVNETTSRVVACANTLTALSCERYDDFDRWPETCTAPPGQLPDGAPCIVPAQCQGSACEITSRAACGVCKTVSRLGGACTDETNCFNFMPCVNGVCSAHPVKGEPCDGIGRYCFGPTVCRDLDANGIGKCGTPSPAGTACDPNEPDICDFTNAYYCDQVTMTCTKGEKARKVGEMCVDLPICNFVSYCDFDGFCRLNPREGMGCGANNTCLTPARCIDGVCKIRNAAVCK